MTNLCLRVSVFIAAGVFTVACSVGDSNQSRSNASQSDQEPSALDNGLNILENAKKVADQGRDALRSVPDDVWQGIKAAWCTIDPAHKVANMDAVFVDISGQANYTAIGAGAGATYALFDGGDGTFRGQSYWHLAGSVGVPKQLGSGTMKVGFIYGCEGSPENYLGDFLGVNLAGYGLQFGAKDWWMYGIYRDIKEHYDANASAQRPKNFDQFLADYSHALRDITHAIKYVNYAWKHDVDEMISVRYPADVPPLTEDDMFHFRSINLTLLKDFFSKIELPSNVEGEVATLSALIDSVLEEEMNLQVSADSFVKDLELVNWYAKTGGGDKRLTDTIARSLALAYTQMEAESTRLARLTHPSLIYSKSEVDGRRVDLIEDGFRDFLKKYRDYGSSTDEHDAHQERMGSVVKWARYVLDALDRKRLAIRGLRLLSFEWMMQLRRDGVMVADQSIGGIDKENWLTGCNAFGMTLVSSSSGAQGLSGAMKTSLSQLGKGTASTLGTIIKAPLTALSMLNPIGWIRTGVSAGGSVFNLAKIRETDVSLSRYYKLPIEHTWENGALGSITGGIRDIFKNLQCDDNKSEQ